MKNSTPTSQNLDVNQMAFVLGTDFNGIDLLKKDGSVRCCAKCGQPTDKYSEPIDTRKKAKWDFSLSRDGFYIVSKRSKILCEENAFRGCRFISLSSGDYVLMPERCVDLDLDAMATCEARICGICGQFIKLTTDSEKPRLAANQIPIADDEFVRSCQETPMVIGCDFWLMAGEAIVDCFKKHRIQRVVPHKLLD